MARPEMLIESLRTLLYRSHRVRIMSVDDIYLLNSQQLKALLETGIDIILCQTSYT
jgi:hypothetical protein